MSEVIYAGVKMPLVKTNTFAQEAVYSEDGLDYLYTKFTLDCRCLLTQDSLRVSRVPVQNDLDLSIANIRKLLLQPRQDFRYSLSHGGSPVIQVGGPDPAGGPFPQGMDIVEIHGGNAAIVAFRIVAHSTDGCGDDRESDREKEVLSNRYTSTMNYDQDFYATRTVSGRIVFRGKQGVQPDEFRDLVMPELPKGFRRRSMSFQVASSGLSLSYTIVDEEHYDFDSASTTSKGSYSEWTEQGGVPVYGEIDISLSAPKNFRKDILIARAAEIALSKFTKFDFLETARVTEDLFRNAISLRVRALKVPGSIKRMKDGVFLFGEKLALPTDEPSAFIRQLLPRQPVLAAGEEFEFDDKDFPDDHSADLSVRNQDIIKALVAEWKRVCGGTDLEKGRYGPSENDTPKSDLDDPGRDIVVEVITADTFLPKPLYSEDHKLQTDAGSAMYLGGDMKVDYYTNNHILNLPIADTPHTELVRTDGDGNPVSGVMNDPDPFFDESVFVLMSRPTMKKRITFSIERIGEKPQVPNAVSDYIVPKTFVKARLIHKSINPSTIRLGADGVTRVFRISGVYEYSFNRALREREKELDIGVMPWIGTDSKSGKLVKLDQERFIKARSFQRADITEENLS